MKTESLRTRTQTATDHPSPATQIVTESRADHVGDPTLVRRVIRRGRALAVGLIALAAGCDVPTGIGPSGIVDGATAAVALQAQAPAPTTTTTTTTAPSTAETGPFCPVAGPHRFTDTWGAPRSGGRRHEGVDLLAETGTPVVAPVAGFVKHRNSSLGGLSFHLDGDDGNYYFGTHLSRYGADGQVAAGTVIGYVGDTGNAAGTPHLHFEIHPGNNGPVNPTALTREWCG